MIDIVKHISSEHIQNMIFSVRDVQIMLDSDLAKIFGVETKIFNQIITQNIDRFPDSFRFQLVQKEYENLKSQNLTLITRLEQERHKKNLPYAFTEQGVSMLSSVLHGEIAINVCIKIINAFAEIRRFLLENSSVFFQLENVARRQIIFESEADKKFEIVFKALGRQKKTLSQGIFYKGQIYDAHVFVSDLIRSAEKSLVLIDNYVDDTVLTLLSKRKTSVFTTICTQPLSKQFLLDIQKHNQQYSSIEIKICHTIHDRFLIIDDEAVYHIGASLKDMGKHCFAFSKMELNAADILNAIIQGNPKEVKVKPLGGAG